MSTPAFWQASEAIHDVVYFSPGVNRRLSDLGLENPWMGYVASRSAAVGRPGAATVAALFHGFAPARFDGTIPRAWELADRDAILRERLDGARDALAEIVDDTDVSDTVAHLAEIHRRASFAGKPLAAAHAELPEPDDDIARLWHHVTWLREFHGDAHVAVLTAAGIDGATANAWASSLGMVPPTQQRSRGWDDAAWDDAYEQLHMRGWVDEWRAPTEAGRAARQRVEETTHRVANAGIGDREATARTIAVTDTLVRLAHRVAETGLLPYPNPTGVPAPSEP